MLKGAHLRVREPGLPERQVALAPDEVLTIGKQPGCALVLEDAAVSSRHGQVTWDADRSSYVLTDCGSANGIMVKGRRVRSLTLTPGITCRLGRTTLQFDEDRTVVPGLGAPEGEARTGLSSAREPAAQPLQGRNEAEVAYRERIESALDQRMRKARAPDESGEELEAYILREVNLLFKEFPPQDRVDLANVRQALVDNMLRLGPLEPYLKDPTVTEIMVNREDRIFVEREGQLTYTGDRFQSRNQLMTVIERIVAPLGRRVDDASPAVDARLPDGSRVNAVIPPLAIDGPSLTIRKFRKDGFSVKALIENGAFTKDMASFFGLCVRERFSIVISGGTGSGKTTLLNTLASFIPAEERIVTIEDSAELRLPQFHVVRLESRPPNLEGKGEIVIRDLVRNALRMRPDRIVVGECRGGEALDMIQAMNTGHDGSMTTVHANNPRDALRRLDVMCMMSGMQLPIDAIREQIASAVHIIIQVQRSADGRRRIATVSEVTGIQNGIIMLQDLFSFVRTGTATDGRVVGHHRATGVVPGWVEELRQRGTEFDTRMFQTENDG